MLHRFSFSAILVAFSLFSLSAQDTSTVRGLVTDPQGAVIPEAVVTLKSVDTSAVRRAVTDSGGVYLFPAILPGAYVLEAQRPGFRTLSQSLTVQVNVPLTANLKLEVGQVTETVNVSAEVTSVNTQDATVGNPFNETQIRQIPLQTRNVVELLSVQPGVTATGEVMGARRDQNNVTLDGVDINDNQRAGVNDAGQGTGFNGNQPGDAGLTAALPLPLDSLQEFRVTVAGQGANQGRSAGGQVTLVTKSGTNSFHGSLYEFNRNTKLAANNWFSNRAGLKREALVRNQFGASVGGPIIKNRAFFFANWERRIDASGQAVNRTVPTETLKQGILRFRQSDGTIGQLTPAELKTLDPLNLGVNNAILDILKQYPAGNDPNLGADRGLNFTGLRFNAPFRRDDQAYVAKLDFNIDRSGKHTAFVRGTLADASQDALVAQFPGQDPASKQLDNSRGISARYIAVLSPTLVNNFTYGFTRLGIARSGVGGTQFSLDSLSDPVNYGARAFGRIIPTHNIANDSTWSKGAHTVQYGINFRLVRNDRTSFQNSFASYSYSRNTLRGLGQDMENIINPYLAQRSGNSSLRMTEGANAIRGAGVLYGLINQYSATYNFDRTGQAVPFGQPVARAFQTREYEFYIQDSWRARRDLTISYGIRYSNTTPPWEANGVQVRTTVGLDTFFAQRVGAALAGQSGASTPSAALTYALAGPANGAPSWFRRDTNNWAPRLNIAYAPSGDTIWHKLFGKGAVLRMGGAMVYDRYGNDLIVEFDRTGSPGLATQVTQPRNSNFSDAARYASGNLPALPTAPAATFPYTPPTILGGFNSQVGVSPDIVAPYSILLNASYARPVASNYTIEVGYVGRLSRKQLLQQDFFQPLSIFKDPQSGQSWIEAAGLLRQAYDRGLTAAGNRANPSAIGRIPFFENMFPALGGFRMPGNATANFFDLVYNEYAGSFTDAINDVDRERIGPNGSCLSRLGCNTFYALQNAGMRAWTNAGNAAFHGGTFTFRRTVSKGFGFDFNYTLSHSIDYASAAEAGAGGGGAALQDAFHPKAFRGSSDFDIRHNITANGLYELPFGKGQKFLSGSNSFVHQLVAGWQISTLMRYRSGLPTVINFGDVWPTNYLNSALGIVAYGAVAPSNQLQFNQLGNPSVFASTSAVKSFAPQFPGQTGMRSIIRLAPLTNFDVAVAKRFYLPWEGHTLQFRAEGFNAFNNVNFFNANVRGDRPSTFGEFQSAMPARVIQLALRCEF